MKAIKLPTIALTQKRDEKTGRVSVDAVRMTVDEALDVLVDVAAHTGEEGARFEAQGVTVIVARGTFAPIISAAFDRAKAEHALTQAGCEAYDSSWDAEGKKTITLSGINLDERLLALSPADAALLIPEQRLRRARLFEARASK